MININEIIVSSVNENVDKVIAESKASANDETSNEVRVYKALMDYSGLILNKYHEALKAELANHGIHI
jgi:hypothetical protein